MSAYVSEHQRYVAAAHNFDRSASQCHSGHSTWPKNWYLDGRAQYRWEPGTWHRTVCQRSDDPGQCAPVEWTTCLSMVEYMGCLPFHVHSLGSGRHHHETAFSTACS